jgi:hypothetical protein
VQFNFDKITYNKILFILIYKLWPLFNFIVQVTFLFNFFFHLILLSEYIVKFHIKLLNFYRIQTKSIKFNYFRLYKLLTYLNALKISLLKIFTDYYTKF